ncbi:hypothetical protein HN371_05445 [Candidatus Poribacteria bacterium]|nr:hypothetical protein [Candidatus Poribacteria bacterium]MBT5713379.1 hypothetical protein [Candidatus Poribacteria bacterium]MBT7099798.1 hypothetical protein [Candidatus Poribacteria bacterium]MBT7804641.1 hypothetical protein [Candidatus Poribacteria bacterium]
MSTRHVCMTAIAGLFVALGAAAQSIRITEVMANPSIAQGGQRGGEFVELFNLSEDPVDLTGWSIGDRDTADEIVTWREGDVAEVPGLGFAIIFDPDMTDGYAIEDETVVWLRPRNAAIGNGLAVRDPLRLMDAAGVVVDTFSPPAPARGGVSFERKDFIAEDTETNWRLTRDPLGVTLGRLSSPDDDPVEEPPTPTIVGLVVINELLYHPKPDAPEWLELRSMADADGLLVGWTLSDSLGQPVAIPTAQLSAGGYAVLTGNAADFRHAHPSLPDGATVVEMPLPSLNDGGDALTLKTAEGTVVDEMSYGALRPDAGRSLERRDVEGDSDRMDNWLLSVDVAGSTPGGANSVIHSTGADPIIQASSESFVIDAGQVEFRYEAAMTARVTLLVLSGSGVLVRTLLDDAPNGGRHAVVWDGHDDDEEAVEPGIYVAQLLAVTDDRPVAASAAVVVEEE